MFDLKIVNGTLVDGSGSKRHKSDIGIKEEIINDFEALFREFTFRDDCFLYAVSSRFMSILVFIKRCMATGNYEFSDKSIFRSLDYIHKNYNIKITLAQLARTERFSISKYRVLFQKYMGVPPVEYIISIRISRACELLTQTDLTIREISESVGYSDQLYFSRIFKKRQGMSPNEYRKSRR
jgi:YesN/AraC family two-component response regulator